MIDVSASAHYVGDCRILLRELPDACVQTCVTSPPYWGLRSYVADGDPMKACEIGLEPTPEMYVTALVQVFRDVRRVLRDDGTLWLNLGDSYAGSSMTGAARPGNPDKNGGVSNRNGLGAVPGLKPKDLVGIPWMTAFALRADGWYLRSDIIWAKPNPMPESVADRPTKAHEYLFLLSKSASYFYDDDAIAEPAIGDHRRNVRDPEASAVPGAASHRGIRNQAVGREVRNKRSVWTVASQPYDGAHFATFPPKLIEPCILAGSRPGDLVIDPFFGSGTTGAVAEKHGRRWIGFDLSYEQLAKERTAQRSLPIGGTP